MTIRSKIARIAKEIYGAAEVKYSAEARREINSFEKMGYGSLPVCIAKTQYSLSDNPKLLGRPKGFCAERRGRAPVVRRRFYRRAYGRDHDDAGPSEASGGRKD